jgi:predicted protein tyrosine phosphatase
VKLNKIIVRPRHEVPKLDMMVPYAVISITDPEPYGEPANVPKRWGLRQVLRLAFHDLDPAKLKPDSELIPCCMQPDHGGHVKGLLDFLPCTDVEALVIHCEAGASRSPSMAMAIADVLGMDRRQIDWSGRDTVTDPINQHVYNVTRKALET